MIDTSREVSKPLRRATLKSAGLGLASTLLPLGGMARAQGRPRPLRRYNASGQHGTHMLKSYAKAVRAMLALPPEDPRNWYRQAIVHTLDCPHGNWWFLPTITMFGHRGPCGALIYTLPLSEKLRQSSKAQPLPADGTIRPRVVPLQAEHHPGMAHGGAVELLGVSVEAY